MEKDNLDKLFNEAVNIVAYKDDEGKIQELIDQGLEIDRLDEYDISLAARAIFGAINYRALHSLWKAGAKATTPYLEEIFAEFKQGKSVEDFYREVEEEKKRNKAREISKNFSAKKLKLQSGHLAFTAEIEGEQDAELELILNLEPFMYDGYFTQTQFEFIGFWSDEMRIQMYTKEGYTFDSEEVEASSIYLQHAHNPVDLKRLTIKSGRKFDTIEVELYFDFEYEATDYKNESLVWKFKQEK